MELIYTLIAETIVYERNLYTIVSEAQKRDAKFAANKRREATTTRTFRHLLNRKYVSISTLLY